MTKKEYYEYCFECESNGEIPLSYEEVAPIKRSLWSIGLAQRCSEDKTRLLGK